MKCSVGIQTRNNKIAGAEVQTDCSNRTLLLYKLAKDRLHNFRTVVSEEDVHFLVKHNCLLLVHGVSLMYFQNFA